jgi:hypothetical protein
VAEIDVAEIDVAEIDVAEIDVASGFSRTKAASSRFPHRSTEI